MACVAVVDFFEIDIVRQNNSRSHRTETDGRHPVIQIAQHGRQVRIVQPRGELVIHPFAHPADRLTMAYDVREHNPGHPIGIADGEEINVPALAPMTGARVQADRHAGRAHIHVDVLHTSPDFSAFHAVHRVFSGGGPAPV